MIRSSGVISSLAAFFAFFAAAAEDPDLAALRDMRVVQVSADNCPIERADAPLAALQDLCLGVQAKAKAARKRDRRALEKLARECAAKYLELYLPALGRTYNRADFDDVARRLERSPVEPDVECLLAASHNAHVVADIAEQQARRDAEEREFFAAFERAQAREVEALDEARARGARPDDPREESGGRKAIRALGLILQGLGQGLAGVHSTASPSAPADSNLSATDSCTSDYACGVGFVCVKSNYSVGGYCAKSVDAYGVPQLVQPRAGSVGVKTPVGTDCRSVGECPIGFRCELSSGACVR